VGDSVGVPEREGEGVPDSDGVPLSEAPIEGVRVPVPEGVGVEVAVSVALAEARAEAEAGAVAEAAAAADVEAVAGATEREGAPLPLGAGGAEPDAGAVDDADADSCGNAEAESGGDAEAESRGDAEAGAVAQALPAPGEGEGGAEGEPNAADGEGAAVAEGAGEALPGAEGDAEVVSVPKAPTRVTTNGSAMLTPSLLHPPKGSKRTSTKAPAGSAVARVADIATAAFATQGVALAGGGTPMRALARVTAAPALASAPSARSHTRTPSPPAQE
jgi:hypothetical protein